MTRAILKSQMIAAAEKGGGVPTERGSATDVEITDGFIFTEELGRLRLWYQDPCGSTLIITRELSEIDE